MWRGRMSLTPWRMSGRALGSGSPIWTRTRSTPPWTRPTPSSLAQFATTSRFWSSARPVICCPAATRPLLHSRCWGSGRVDGSPRTSGGGVGCALGVAAFLLHRRRRTAGEEVQGVLRRGVRFRGVTQRSRLPPTRSRLADHVSTALTAGAGLLALAVVVTAALVLPSGVAEHRLARAAGDGQPEPAQLAGVDGVPRPGPPALTAAGTGS